MHFYYKRGEVCQCLLFSIETRWRWELECLFVFVMAAELQGYFVGISHAVSLEDIENCFGEGLTCGLLMQ